MECRFQLHHITLSNRISFRTQQLIPELLDKYHFTVHDEIIISDRRCIDDKIYPIFNGC